MNQNFLRPRLQFELKVEQKPFISIISSLRQKIVKFCLHKSLHKVNASISRKILGKEIRK